MNFAIYWISNTKECTRIINSDDPNEVLETGSRPNKLPFPEPPPEDEKYRAIYNQLFANGPKFKFVGSDKFVGSLFGYVFYMGDNGLGYYIDPYVMRYVFYN